MDAPVALVTGGGSGIGLAVAEHLIHLHGYRVAIVDIDAARVARESARIHPHNCLGICADVTDYTQQSHAFLQTFEWGGNHLDFIFLNAGIGDTDSIYKDTHIDPTTTLPLPLDLRTLDVNLNAVIQGVHLARHFFLTKNPEQPNPTSTAKRSISRGKILVTSSSVGLYPLHAIPLYSASKHGLVGLVRSMAPVFLKDRITINALNPALVYTNLMPRFIAEEFHVPEQTTPMSTVLKAVDAVLESDTLTGQTMELTLDEVVFTQTPEYSRGNVRWMFEQWGLWERVVGELMPRAVGENAVAVERPGREAI